MNSYIISALCMCLMVGSALAFINMHPNIHVNRDRDRNREQENINPQVINCYNKIYVESIQCQEDSNRKWNRRMNYLVPVPFDRKSRQACCSDWMTFDCIEKELNKCNPNEQISSKMYLMDKIHTQSNGDCNRFPYHSAQCRQQTGCTENNEALDIYIGEQ